MVARLVGWLHREAFEFDAPETPGRILHFRLVESFVVAATVVFVWRWAWDIPRQPGVLFPLGLARYLALGWLHAPGVAMANAAVVTVLVSLGFRRRGRWPYLAALVLFHLQYVTRYSLGATAHGANLTGMSLLALGLAGMVGAGQPEIWTRRFALGSIYIFAGLGYLAAALSKLVGTGLAWPAGRHLLLWIGERGVDMLSTHGAWEPNLVQRWVLASPAAGTMMLALGLAAESAGPLMIARRFRTCVIPALVAMHVGTSVVMNIDFPVYLVQLVLLGLPWARWFDRRATRTSMTVAGTA